MNSKVVKQNQQRMLCFCGARRKLKGKFSLASHLVVNENTCMFIFCFKVKGSNAEIVTALTVGSNDHYVV